MANVKKCDRCDKVYEPDYNATPKKGQLALYEYVGDNVYRLDEKDLCDSCRKSLEDWFRCRPVDITFDVKPLVGIDFSIDDYLTKCGAKYSR